MWEWSPEFPFLKYLSVLFWTWESNTKQGSKLWPSRSEEKPGICSWWFSFQLHKLATRKSVIYTDFQASEERYIDHVGVRTRCWSLITLSAHYGCKLRLSWCADHICEAKECLKKMPYEARPSILAAWVGACGIDRLYFECDTERMCSSWLACNQRMLRWMCCFHLSVPQLTCGTTV